MGVSMVQMNDRKFKILSANKLMALRALKSTAEHSGTIRWVDSSAIKRASSLEEALNMWHWAPKVDMAGTIVDLQFMGEKEGDEFILFTTIAPFVESGSYIRTFASNQMTTWKFEGGRCSKELV